MQTPPVRKLLRFRTGPYISHRDVFELHCWSLSEKERLDQQLYQQIQGIPANHSEQWWTDFLLIPSVFSHFWRCANICEQTDGAQERTRTFTTVRSLAPEASASTNSATWAWGGLLRFGRALVKLARLPSNRLFK